MCCSPESRTKDHNKEVEIILTHELRSLSRWADENKMDVNHSKTKSMTVCSKPKFWGLDGENLNVRTDKGQLDSVVESKLLGIKLDNCLTWENHMACVKEKIGKRLGLLKRTKTFLSLKAGTLFYSALLSSQYLTMGQLSGDPITNGTSKILSNWLKNAPE